MHTWVWNNFSMTKHVPRRTIYDDNGDNNNDNDDNNGRSTYHDYIGSSVESPKRDKNWNGCQIQIISHINLISVKHLTGTQVHICARCEVLVVNHVPRSVVHWQKQLYAEEHKIACPFQRSYLHCVCVKVATAIDIKAQVAKFTDCACLKPVF